MAITNEMIILAEAVSHLDAVFKAYADATAYIMEYDEVPLHTFAGWKSRGYMVKKGVHSSIATKLWKFKGRKSEKEDETDGYCLLTKSYLFTIDQVQKIED